MNEGLKGGQVTIQCADYTRQLDSPQIQPVWTWSPIAVLMGAVGRNSFLLLAFCVWDIAVWPL